MDFLPKELEDIIIDYKKELEYQELVENHRISFNETLNTIQKIRNRSTKIRNHNVFNNIFIITISRFFHRKLGYSYCYCFQVCKFCNDYIHSSRQNTIATNCLCHCNN